MNANLKDVPNVEAATALSDGEGASRFQRTFDRTKAVSRPTCHRTP